MRDTDSQDITFPFPDEQGSFLGLWVGHSVPVCLAAGLNQLLLSVFSFSLVLC